MYCQPAGAPIVQVCIAIVDPNKFVAATFIDGLGRQARDGLNHHLESGAWLLEIMLADSLNDVLWHDLDGPPAVVLVSATREGDGAGQEKEFVHVESASRIRQWHSRSRNKIGDP
jgi:hypothetical protein